MATAVPTDTKLAAKQPDPLASKNIPELIEDTRVDPQGITNSLSYKRGKLLGRVKT